MKIKKGKWYVCIRDYYHPAGWYDDPAKTFIKGKLYYAAKDEYLHTPLHPSEFVNFRPALKEEIPIDK